ncbi:hypothetical protein [Arhodomonas sp. AD133]|uniref:hypothetical protein n=1 Tax=Arhodomonas sp. AD133 TaxID=3415009 RepID=UPI003EB6F3F8
MREDKRKPKRQASAKKAVLGGATGEQHMTYRRSRQAARRLMRRGVFNKRIVDQAETKRGRG